MQKFCTNCGKPLPENGICDCQQAAQQAAYQAPQQAAPQDNGAPMFQSTGNAANSAYVQKTKETMGQSANFVKSYWKDPMKATVGLLRAKDMTMAIIMIAVNAILAGLTLHFACSKFINSLVDTTAKMFDISKSSMPDIEVPFITNLLMGIGISLVILAISAVAIFLVLKLANVNAGFKHVVQAIGANTVFCSAALILAILFIFIGWATGVVIALSLCAIVWCVMLTTLLVKVFNVPMTGLNLAAAGVLLTAVVLVGIWAGGKMSLKAAGEISVDNETLSDSFEELGEVFEDFDMESFVSFANGF